MQNSRAPWGVKPRCSTFMICLVMDGLSGMVDYHIHNSFTTTFNPFLHQGAGVVMGLATLLCPLSSKSYILLMVYFVTFGFAEGSSATPINYLILTCVPEQARSKSFGFWLFCLSFTMAIGPPFAGMKTKLPILSIIFQSKHMSTSEWK